MIMRKISKSTVFRLLRGHQHRFSRRSPGKSIARYET